MGESDARPFNGPSTAPGTTPPPPPPPPPPPRGRDAAMRRAAVTHVERRPPTCGMTFVSRSTHNPDARSVTVARAGSSGSVFAKLADSANDGNLARRRKHSRIPHAMHKINFG